MGCRIRAQGAAPPVDIWGCECGCPESPLPLPCFGGRGGGDRAEGEKFDPPPVNCLKGDAGVLVGVRGFEPANVAELLLTDEEAEPYLMLVYSRPGLRF